MINKNQMTCVAIMLMAFLFYASGRAKAQTLIDNVKNAEPFLTINNPSWYIHGLAFGTDGNMYFGMKDRLYKIAPDKRISLFSVLDAANNTAHTHIWNIDIGPDSCFYSAAGDRILKFTPQGAVSTLGLVNYTGGYGALDLRFDNKGNFYYVAYDKVYKCDKSLTPVVFIDGKGLFTEGTGMAFNNDCTKLYITDPPSKNVIQYSITSDGKAENPQVIPSVYPHYIDIGKNNTYIGTPSTDTNGVYWLTKDLTKKYITKDRKMGCTLKFGNKNFGENTVYVLDFPNIIYRVDLSSVVNPPVVPTLKYLGQASTKIKTADNTTIYIDPYAGSDYADSADIVLVTHQHSDHNQINLVKKKSTCTVISNAQALVGGVYKSFTVGNVKIDAVAAYNANHDKSSCVGYVLEFDGMKLYHAGDTGFITEMAELASRKLDYALLPMDGVYTMTPEEATQAAGVIKAKNYIPIHTISSVDQMAARFTVSNKVVLQPGSSVELKVQTTGFKSEASVRKSFLLEQNYPNPFNPETNIRFSLAEPGWYSLVVYNLLGEEVAKLAVGEMTSGYHKVSFNASGLPNGVYVYTLRGNDVSVCRKMIVLK